MDRRPPPLVIPVKAGISRFVSQRPKRTDASVRWHDGMMVGALFAISALAACSPASEPGAVTADEATS